MSKWKRWCLQNTYARVRFPLRPQESVCLAKPDLALRDKTLIRGFESHPDLKIVKALVLIYRECLQSCLSSLFYLIKILFPNSLPFSFYSSNSDHNFYE